MSTTADAHIGDRVESTFPGGLFHGRLLPVVRRPRTSNRRSVEFDELTVPYPADGQPARRSRRATRDTLAVDASLDGRSVDADRLEVLDDQIGEIAITEIGRIEAPEFANTHFSGVVDG